MVARAMTRPLWGAVVLGLLGGAVAGCKSVKKHYEDHFKATYTLQFNNACVKRATEDRVPEARAKSYCACTARYLVEHHSLGELMLVGMTSSASSEKAIDAAARVCRIVD
jgi:hypothetical protein